MFVRIVRSIGEGLPPRQTATTPTVYPGPVSSQPAPAFTKDARQPPFSSFSLSFPPWPHKAAFLHVLAWLFCVSVRNVITPSSGFVYFSLKIGKSTVRSLSHSGAHTNFVAVGDNKCCCCSPPPILLCAHPCFFFKFSCHHDVCILVIRALVTQRPDPKGVIHAGE